MNLSEFFLPSSLESRLVRSEQQHQKQSPPLLRMPPRSASKDVISASDEAADVMAPTIMDHLHLSRTHHVSTSVQLERIHSREKDRRESLPRPSDLTFYVGRNRVPFNLSADTLKHSTYFGSLLEKQRIPDPIVLDCDEGTFQNIVLILRYGSFEALPKMSESEMFRLKRELECYGIDVPAAETRKPNSPTSTSSSPHRLSAQSSQLARPHSQQMTTKLVQHRSAFHHASSASGDFPDLPEELKDPSKLFLVARMDDIEKGIRCECTGKDLHTYWALSFHYRHTFCTGCGRCPTSFSPRHLAEMYMAAAMCYSNENFSNKQRWSVGCDSTCSLKALNAKPNCVCPCAMTETCCESESPVSGSAPRLPAWAVSTYYSHAFCTRCGRAAEERTLIFILLTHRYGGVSKHSKLRRDHAVAVSEGAVAQDLRHFANSPGSEILRHSRGNRSM